MYVGFVACDDCGDVLPGERRTDGDLGPIGVADCPTCGGGEWSPLSPTDRGVWAEDADDDGPDSG